MACYFKNINYDKVHKEKNVSSFLVPLTLLTGINC